MTVGELIRALETKPPHMKAAVYYGSDYVEISVVEEVELVERGGWVSSVAPKPSPPDPNNRWVARDPEAAEASYRQALQRHHDDLAKCQTYLEIR